MDIKLKLKLKELQSLPIEELGKLYDNANNDDRAEIVRLVNKNANEFISDARSTIREINSEIQNSKFYEVF